MVHVITRSKISIYRKILVYAIAFLGSCSFLFITNAIFIIFKQKRIAIDSNLTFEEGQILIMSFIPSVVIAIFQFFIQEKIEEKNEKKQKIDYQNYINELESSIIHNFLSEIQWSVQAYNFILMKYTYCLCEETDKTYCIRLSNKYKNQLFSSYYKVDIEKIVANYKYKNLKNEMNISWTKNINSIEIFLNSEYRDFFRAPVNEIVEIRDNYEISIDMFLQVTDIGMKVNDISNKKQKDENVNTKIVMNLSIKPGSGYDDRGIFNLQIINFSLKSIKKEEQQNEN